VFAVLNRLFPNFGPKIGINWGDRRASNLEQGIGDRPRVGRSYLERFLAGCLPANDVADQPTLQFIRKTMRDGFDQEVFYSMYLDTRKANRGVQQIYPIRVPSCVGEGASSLRCDIGLGC